MRAIQSSMRIDGTVFAGDELSRILTRTASWFTPNKTYKDKGAIEVYPTFCDPKNIHTEFGRNSEEILKTNDVYYRYAKIASSNFSTEYLIETLTSPAILATKAIGAIEDRDFVGLHKTVYEKNFKDNQKIKGDIETKRGEIWETLEKFEGSIRKNTELINLKPYEKSIYTAFKSVIETIKKNEKILGPLKERVDENGEAITDKIQMAKNAIYEKLTIDYTLNYLAEKLESENINHNRKNLRPLRYHDSKDAMMNVIVGPPGSGKSQAQKQVLKEEYEARKGEYNSLQALVSDIVNLNPDFFKFCLYPKIPETHKEDNGNLTHAESSILYDAFSEFLKTKQTKTGELPHIITDVNRSDSWLRNLLRTLKPEGDIYLTHVSLPTIKQLERSKERGNTKDKNNNVDVEGRVMPTERILRRTVDDLKFLKETLANSDFSVTLFSNNVDFGQKPKLMASSSNSGAGVRELDIYEPKDAFESLFTKSSLNIRATNNINLSQSGPYLTALEMIKFAHDIDITFKDLTAKTENLELGSLKLNKEGQITFNINDYGKLKENFGSGAYSARHGVFKTTDSNTNKSPQLQRSNFEALIEGLYLNGIDFEGDGAELAYELINSIKKGISSEINGVKLNETKNDFHVYEYFLDTSHSLELVLYMLSKTTEIYDNRRENGDKITAAEAHKEGKGTSENLDEKREPFINQILRELTLVYDSLLVGYPKTLHVEQEEALLIAVAFKDAMNVMENSMPILEERVWNYERMVVTIGKAFDSFQSDSYYSLDEFILETLENIDNINTYKANLFGENAFNLKEQRDFYLGNGKKEYFEGVKKEDEDKLETNIILDRKKNKTDETTMLERMSYNYNSQEFNYLSKSSEFREKYDPIIAATTLESLYSSIKSGNMEEIKRQHKNVSTLLKTIANNKEKIYISAKTLTNLTRANSLVIPLISGAVDDLDASIEAITKELKFSIEPAFTKVKSIPNDDFKDPVKNRLANLLRKVSYVADESKNLRRAGKPGTTAPTHYINVAATSLLRTHLGALVGHDLGEDVERPKHGRVRYEKLVKIFGIEDVYIIHSLTDSEPKGSEYEKLEKDFVSFLNDNNITDKNEVDKHITELKKTWIKAVRTAKAEYAEEHGLMKVEDLVKSYTSYDKENDRIIFSGEEVNLKISVRLKKGGNNIIFSSDDTKYKLPPISIEAADGKISDIVANLKSQPLFVLSMSREPSKMLNYIYKNNTLALTLFRAIDSGIKDKVVDVSREIYERFQKKFIFRRAGAEDTWKMIEGIYNKKEYKSWTVKTILEKTGKKGTEVLEAIREIAKEIYRPFADKVHSNALIERDKNGNIKMEMLGKVANPFISEIIENGVPVNENEKIIEGPYV